MGDPVIPLTPQQPGPMQPGEFVSASIPNVVTFGFERVPPPSTVYVQRDDLLLLTGITQVSGGDVLTITARLLLPIGQRPGQPSYTPPPPTPPASATATATGAGAQTAHSEGKFHGLGLGPGVIQIVQRQLILSSPGTLYSLVISLAEGYLLSVAITSANATVFAQTYVGAYIGRGSPSGGSPVPAQLLIADYPTNVIPVGWPGVPLRQTASSQGLISSVIPSNPSAGSGYTYTTTAGLRTRIHSVNFLFTTSSTAANRVVYVGINDNNGYQVAVSNSNYVQGASLAYQYSFFIGGIPLAPTTNNTQAIAPMPQVDLGSVWTLNINVNNMQAADTLTNIRLALETWVA
jgi:hypothetical protein